MIKLFQHRSGDTKTIRVVYWNNIPAPYVVDRLNELSKISNLKVSVCFGKREKKYREWPVSESEWNFESFYVNGVTRYYDFLRKIYAKKYDVLVLAGYYRIDYILIGLFAKILNVKVIFVVDGVNKWRKDTLLKRFIKNKVLRISDAIFVNGNEALIHYKELGVSEKKMFLLPHNIDVPFYRSNNIDGDVGEIKDKLFKKSIGCDLKYLFVGRLWSGKGMDNLFYAWESLTKINRKICLFIVGSGPDELAYKNMFSIFSNVYFLGYLSKEELKYLYLNTEIFVFPTMGDPYGFVLDEAMACGMAVIVSDMAGDIQDRINSGTDGLLYDASSSEELYGCMKMLMENETLRKQIAKNAWEKMGDFSLKRWANKFAENIMNVYFGGVVE